MNVRPRFLSALWLSFLLPLLVFGGEAPLAVYLTWAEDPTTTMVVEWISQEKEAGPIHYRKESSEEAWAEKEPITIPFPNQQPYYVHRSYLKGLVPNTSYAFTVEGDSEKHTCSTMPEDLTTPVTFIVGGDVNLSDPAVFDQTTQKAVSLNPSFIVIGGDLSCAASISASKPENVNQWLTWIRHWSATARTKEGKLIPLLVTLGNHDVQGFYGQTPAQAQYAHCLFANLGPQGYSVIRFDHYLSLYLLDSGHTNSVGGVQSTWLGQEMSQDARVVHRIAVYHVPAYPDVRPYRNNYSTAIRRHFVPIFDKYHLHVAFEHHEHAYKRTFPLTAGHIDPRGVIYIGNGSWGVSPRVPTPPRRTMYLEKTVQARGFCIVTLSSKDREITAMAYDGTVIDQVRQPTDAVVTQDRLEQERLLMKKRETRLSRAFD